MAIKTPQKTGWRENYFLKAFLLGLGLSFVIFLPFIIVDGGRFLFYGDFNVQQVPFTGSATTRYAPGTGAGTAARTWGRISSAPTPSTFWAAPSSG